MGTRPCAALIAIVLVGLVSGAARSQDFSQVEIRRIDLAPGVAMLTGQGGNIGVSAGPDGVVLVDDQYAPLTEKITAAVAEMSDRPVRFVVNTHWHSDHTGGNENFGKLGAVLVAHDNVRARLSVDQVMEAFGRTVPASPPGALPVVTFADSVRFHLNGDTVHVFHVDPAHTDGDSIVRWENANVFHAGDAFLNGMYPFVDLSSGGDIDGIIAAGERLLALTNAQSRIIPGHGPLARRADLEDWVAMLKAVRGRVADGIAAGSSVEEVIATQPTAEFDARYGQGFIDPERFVRFTYASLGDG